MDIFQGPELDSGDAQLPFPFPANCPSRFPGSGSILGSLALLMISSVGSSSVKSWPLRAADLGPYCYTNNSSKVMEGRGYHPGLRLILSDHETGNHLKVGIRSLLRSIRCCIERVLLLLPNIG